MEPMDTTVANNAATGGPGTIRIGKRLCLASQPTRADFVTLRKFLSQTWQKRNTKPLTAVATELRDMPQELRELVQAGAVSRAVDRSTGNAAPEVGDLSELITDPEVAAFWAWHLCRKTDPSLTLAECEAATKEPGTVDELLADLLLATSMKDVAPKPHGGNGSSS